MINQKESQDHGIQTSEAFVTSSLLALSGGFQDAYTYNVRDGVFSNAETGNVVLMSQHLMAGEWSEGLRYLFPILAFVIGVFVAEKVQAHFRFARKLHWRQSILLVEILILFSVGFMPHSWNMIATMFVSFACALQVQTFRKVGGYSYASTMCIGNMRSGTAAFSVFLRCMRLKKYDKAKKQLKMAFYYFGIIFMFAVGAGIGGNLSLQYGYRMIWISCLFLFIAFLLMFHEFFQIREFHIPERFLPEQEAEEKKNRELE